MVDEFHKAFLESPKTQEWLQDERGIDLETAKRFRLGLRKSEKRLIIPIFDEAGGLVNLRRYSPTDDHKMLNWKGFGAAVIYGLPELKGYPVDDELIVCEGEFDRLLLVQAGFHAVTHTNGATSFQESWRPLFKGRKVVLCYDADEGGRKGAEKTAGILSSVVTELKILDLEKAGLVAGTKEDNDVSDLARKGPDWPQELRRAIDACVGMDLACGGDTDDSGEPDDSFVRVVEQGGGYWKPNKKDKLVPISNFLIYPTRRVWVAGQEILEARIGSNGNGNGGAEVTLWPHQWTGKAVFKWALGALGSGFKGSEDDIQEIKVLLAEKDCPRFIGEPKLGLHFRDNQWILVTSDKTITLNGEIEDLIFWSDSATRISYDTSRIQPATPDDVRAVARAMTDFNAFGATASIVGWMTAVPFKARLIEAVPALRRQFPLLLVWGGKGAGKTKTAEMVIQPFFGEWGEPRKVDEMTKFTFMLAAHGTNLVPLIFDEYKPSKLSARQVQEVSSFCRSVFNSVAGERGHSGPEGLGSKVFTYTAPVVILGEQGFMEPALKERIIEASLSREGRQGKRHIQDFMTMNMPGVGFAYIRWGLGVTDPEIAEVWKVEFGAADEAFEDRIRQNVATARMGLRLWDRFLVGQGVNDWPADQMCLSIDRAQKAAVMGDGPRPRNDIDLIIEGLSSMAAMDRDTLKEGEDWKVEEGRLYLRLQTAYPKFKRWAREYGFDGEVLDENSFKRRLKEERYFEKRTTINIYHNMERQNVKVWALSIGEMDAAGLDLSGFGVEEIPF